MATLSLNNIKKQFGKTEVIHGVSADVSDGEFIVIVGPSGCGKSTLLRMVAGLETVTSGEILIDDGLVNDKEPMDRDIAMVFQNYALYPHMSVRQNMAYGLKIAGTPKNEIRVKVEEAAKLLQLEPYLDRKPRALSGGQRQRVAMGRAIVREPSIFLFDEPLSNLDAKLRVQMRLEIKQLQSDLGVTALYVTHDQVEAMTMADRMIVMNAGVAEQIGSPLEVYERPQTLFTSQFIGSPAMNILDGRIDAGRLTLSNGASLAVNSSTTGAVKIGIRPEHLVADDTGELSIKIGFTEPLGATTLLYGELEGSTATNQNSDNAGTVDGSFSTSSELVTISLPGVHTTVRQGDVGRFSVPPDKIHLFNPDTEQRIET
ncbi:MAG: sn-glycerol-3-phosphate ABC transporter ATP-binding protein UgpC [Granulosicoccus sp.]|nr:sn-glycerol-3-phosphate ABC transporter ATP-binding protein UgpC [Granulosicoccus sp.]